MLRPERALHLVFGLLPHVRQNQHLQNQFARFTACAHKKNMLEVVIQFTARKNYLRFFALVLLDLSAGLLLLSFRAERGILALLTADGRRLIAFFNDAISTAASAASNPLFPIFNPARSMACSRFSQVSTPNACGTPVSCADCPIPRVTSLTITS